MNFWIGFFAINFFSFLPMYLLNLQEQKNPFLLISRKDIKPKGLLYSALRRRGKSDPFRIHLEFSVIFLFLLLLKAPSNFTIIFSSLLLTLNTSYLIYTCSILFILKRPPKLNSDINLLKSGLIIFKRYRLLLFITLLLTISLIFAASYFAISWIAPLHSGDTFTQLMTTTIAITILLGLGLFNVKRTPYPTLHWRNVFPSTIHLFKNIQLNKKYEDLLKHNIDFYREKNPLSGTKFETKPNMVFICIESYGAIAFRDNDIQSEIDDLLKDYEKKIVNQNFTISSSLSTSPIYSGGSWLSYSTFMYGLRLDNINLYDALFTLETDFSNYESIFHLLKNNNYHNGLLSAMGGVDTKDVDWTSLDRMFQCDTRFEFETITYKGKTTPFFAQHNRYCLPDQYAVNYAYERLKEEVDSPFSLFFCTMNSHIPYESPIEKADNWQDLNSPNYNFAVTTDKKTTMKERYKASVKYQLDMALDFVLNNKDDDLVVVLFGDHQPPLVSDAKMGLETPVHIISKHNKFNTFFEKNGFVRGLDLSQSTNSIKHEGFMSIFINACQQAFGLNKEKVLPILPDGNLMFKELEETQ